MEEYNNIQNYYLLNKACSSMLFQKFEIILNDNELNNILDNVMIDINGSQYSHLTLKELNNLTLTRIKSIFDKKEKKENNETYHTSVLDDETILNKLKELEVKRQIIPSFENVENIISTDKPLMYKKELNNIQPISITLPKNMNDKIYYKNFVVSSLNRDWTNNKFRNNISFNVPYNTYNNNSYIQCIFFPSYVKNITPYIFMRITDNNSTQIYSLICDESNNNSKWNVWKPLKDIEKISLQNKTWSIKFYDYINNDLNIGHDDIKILEVSKIDKNIYKLHIEPNNDVFDIGDIIQIKINNDKKYLKKIIGLSSENIDIFDDNNEFNIEDFINSSILNVKNQFSIFIKYNYVNN